MKLTAAQLDRACGVLLGSAAGDALGAGYEFTFPASDLLPVMKGGASAASLQASGPTTLIRL